MSDENKPWGKEAPTEMMVDVSKGISMTVDNAKKITFEVAVAEPEDRQRVQTVDIITDMTQRCSRCKVVVVGTPLGLSLVNTVGHAECSKAQRAVATAMYNAHVEPNTEPTEPQFDELPWTEQEPWLRSAAADGWRLESFSLDAIGVGSPERTRQAGIAEAKKWAAYSDRRKTFRVTSAQFPPGWVHIGFTAHSGKTGEPVEHAYVGVNICPKCAPAIFDAAGVDPTDPLANGVKW